MSEKEPSLTSDNGKPEELDRWKAFDRWIDFYVHLFERVKLQEEARDRWFRYYLIIMGSAATMLGVFLRLANEGERVALSWFFPLFGFFLGTVGILFFLLALSQRYNYRTFMERMTLLEEQIFYPMLPDEKAAARMESPLPASPIAKAAVTGHRLFLLINSLVLAVSSATTLQMILCRWHWATGALAVIVFIACGWWHHARISKLEEVLCEPRKERR